MPVRFPRENNPFYPLPPDYDQLDAAGQRAARLNAIALRETPEDMVFAWDLFRNYYLNHEHAHFYKKFLASGVMHYEMVSFFRAHRLNAVAAPRAGAKSTVIGTEVPLLEMLSPSVPGMSMVLFLAKDQFVEQRFDKFMIQLEENQRIRDDFGRLRPAHGSGAWNRHHLRLSNHVEVVGISIDGKKRGQRPDLAIVDDVEYDAESHTDILAVNEDWHSMLTRQIIGMLEPWSILFWIGTLLSQRSFLRHIITAHDPKFLNWNRRVFTAIYTDPDTGEQRSAWEAKWPMSYLEELRAQMGEGAFRTEMLNDPTGDDEPVLAVDKTLSGYDLVTPATDPTETPQALDAPLACELPIRWHDCTSDHVGAINVEARTAPFKDVVGPLKRFITVDYAPTTTARSDYSACVVWGMDSKNTLWVLDVWYGRVSSTRLLSIIWELGNKWQVKAVGVEAVAMQDTIRQQVADLMHAKALSGLWAPRVFPIRYPGNVAKEDRIGGLEWRFRRGRIKLPDYLRHNHQMAELFRQIEDFTPDLSRLEHDDVVDALSMAHYLLPSGSRATPTKKTDPTTVADFIEADRLWVAPGVNLLQGLDVAQLPVELLDKLYARDRDETQTTLSGRMIARANEFAPYIDADELGVLL